MTTEDQNVFKTKRDGGAGHYVALLVLPLPDFVS